MRGSGVHVERLRTIELKPGDSEVVVAAGPMGPCVLSVLAPLGVGYWLIIANSNLPPDKQESGVAHALAHWALHRNHGPFVCEAGASGPLEDEANAFAAELLGQGVMRRAET